MKKLMDIDIADIISFSKGISWGFNSKILYMAKLLFQICLVSIILYNIFATKNVQNIEEYYPNMLLTTTNSDGSNHYAFRLWENGNPIFWCHIKDNVRKDKINYKLNCPMNYLSTVKLKKFNIIYMSCVIYKHNYH